ncbi:MAG: methylthioadenosine phosphorylase [Acidobacteria bacterium RIFCSPLOWO2_12_FULL_54_10]|nr:MAG: methylthioadenosine phosphorylase [Acidobacteria bacterium RIFCSPLOWO2_12_FULL_54_10]
MSQAEIGVIGGSGLYSLPGLENVQEIAVETPFGAPSDSYFLGAFKGRRLAFLPRHGRGHRILPSHLNFRANIYGFKKLGVERIVSFSAVGSLREEFAPMSFVLPDQFFDRTRGRVSTFFGEGLVVHISFADPICHGLLDVLESACKSAQVVVHRGGTYVCMEGPQFSTKAESNVYRSWGMDIIGMTNLQEAKLAREAELCYATVAMVTDYDCWHPGHEAVTVDTVISYLMKNSANAARVLTQAIEKMPASRTCKCGSALAHSIQTDKTMIPPEARKKFDLLVGKYLSS